MPPTRLLFPRLLPVAVSIEPSQPSPALGVRPPRPLAGRLLVTALTGAVALAASCAFAADVVVQPGDTLWALANRHGTSVEALRAANGLAGDALRPGQTLRLPGGAAGAASPPEAAPSPEHVVRPGDTLYDIAVAYGVSVDEIIAWNELDGSVIRPGQTLRLAASPEEPPEPLVVTVAPGDSLWALARRYDTTSADIANANGFDVDRTIRPGDRLTIPGRFASADGDLDQGGAAAPTIVVAAGDNLSALAQRYDTTVAALMAANGLSGTSIYAGQELRVVPSRQIPRAGVESAAPAAPPTAMVWPLVGPITSRFGYRRLSITNGNTHSGLDIDGRTGDPIRAAASGVVSYAGWQGGYGNLVVIENGDTEYYYAHASELLVRTGDRVGAGTLIARVGSTGRSTGSHLHFEIRVAGTPVDPLPILETRATR